MVQECKQVIIQIMGALSKAGVGALTRMKGLQTRGSRKCQLCRKP